MGSRAQGRLEPVPAASAPGRATFLELFFDLVFVFALTRISTRAFEDLTDAPGREHGWSAVTGSGKTLLLLLALWAVWQGTAWTTSRYDPYRVPAADRGADRAGGQHGDGGGDPPGVQRDRR